MGEELLVGIVERPRLDNDGGGGAGGAGDGDSSSARVERWTLEGERLASYDVLGDPRAAVPARGGWLIAQTNSFWGSYRAAVDWLSPQNELVRLAEVPVQSAGDGEDGAYDVAVRDTDVLVANCESGLLGGVWETNEPVQLSNLAGPWFSQDTLCNPTELAVVGDVLVSSGERLDFARFCE